MANRTRNIVLRVPVTPEERALIQQKMAQLHTKNFSAYARKMLIDGYIVHMDTSDIRAQTAELQKIGVNVNQIARRINICRKLTAPYLPPSPKVFAFPKHRDDGAMKSLVDRPDGASHFQSKLNGSPSGWNTP